MLIASTRNPPPGNTNIETPAFSPFGGKIVLVGIVTLVTPPYLELVSAASGAPVMWGARLGQIGTCVNPVGGAQVPTVHGFVCCLSELAARRPAAVRDRSAEEHT